MPHSADQFSGIFICYRHAGSAGHAGRLYDRLAERFGHEQIFMDVYHIEEGEDFEKAIRRAVGSCEILIAVIDQNWLAGGDDDRSLLDDPKDYVRQEIEEALRRGVGIIPVLVQGASMPRPRELPEELSQFCTHQAKTLSERGWHFDISSLILTVDGMLAARREERRREDKRRRRRAEELARASRSDRLTSLLTRPMREGYGGAIAALGTVVLVVMAVVAALFLASRWGREQEVSRVPSPPPVEKHLESFTEPLDGLDETDKKLNMVAVHGGTFRMGLSPRDLVPYEKAQAIQEKAVGGFYIGMYEVTRAQWSAVMGSDKTPSRFSDDDNLPVDNVSFSEAEEFCERLSRKTKKDYRLPKEKEWEYAARAGERATFTFGPSLSSKQANFNGTFPYGDGSVGPYVGKTTPVASYEPNGLGLYDVHGNVWEWCDDFYQPSDSLAPESSDRVLRGGAWDSPATSLRSGYRIAHRPWSGNESRTIGFRVAMTAP